jgi:hypothetical protein
MLFLAWDLEVIRHRKYARNLVGTDVDQVLVSTRIHHTLQSHVSAVHDYVDGPVGADAVALQRAIAVDGTKELHPQTVVHRGRGQHLNLIGDPFNAFNLLDCVLSIRFERRVHHMPEQRDVVAFNLEADGVKLVVIRQHENLMGYLFLDPLREPGWRLGILLRPGG